MRQFGQRQFAGLKLPTVAQVLTGVTFGGNAALTGTVVLPSAGDVRKGITFGPSSGTTGTYELQDPPDLTNGNLNQIEETEIYALDSYYAVTGINAEYYTKADDSSKWIVVVMLSRSETLQYENDIQYERETLVVLLRRFGANAIERPAKGDRLSLTSPDGVRKYTLTETPVVSSGQLEWKAEFSRSKQVKAGGRDTVRQV
jgi:hypothetical protein